jgi:hypothetical protein
MRFSTILMVFLLVLGVSASFAQAQEEITTYSERIETPKVIQLFPNPATDFLNVKLGDLNASKVKVTLHNIIGNEMPVESEVVDDAELRIRVKDLASGYYLLSIKEEEANYRGTFKFLKR